MKKRLSVQIISLFLVAITLGLWGCEQKMSAPIINNSGEYTPGIDDYFPLSAGKTTRIISTNTGYEPYIIKREQFECGEGIELENQSVYSWIHTNLAYSSISDTSYFHRTETTLYFYETADSEPEIILEEPLEVGQTWQRFGDPTAGSDNLFTTMLEILTSKHIDDVEIILDDKDDFPDENGFSTGKIYPTSGSSLMTIVAVEDVALDDGRVFADCIKVRNERGEDFNYYWYAPNYGLIKYVIGASTESLALAEIPDGLIIGEYATGSNLFQ